MKKKLVSLLAVSTLVLAACGGGEEAIEEPETEGIADEEDTKASADTIEENESDKTEEIEEVEFVPFEDNEEAQEIADGAILGDDPETQAGFATLFLNNSFDGMFEFEENNEEKTIVGYPVNEELEERIEDFKDGDTEIKQSFYNVFSELDFQFLGVLHGIDDDYEIQILDERESDNKLIVFNKDGYVHNSFAN